MSIGQQRAVITSGQAAAVPQFVTTAQVEAPLSGPLSIFCWKVAEVNKSNFGREKNFWLAWVSAVARKHLQTLQTHARTLTLLFFHSHSATDRFWPTPTEGRHISTTRKGLLAAATPFSPLFRLQYQTCTYPLSPCAVWSSSSSSSSPTSSFPPQSCHYFAVFPLPLLLFTLFLLLLMFAYTSPHTLPNTLKIHFDTCTHSLTLTFHSHSLCKPVTTHFLTQVTLPCTFLVHVFI